MELVITTDLAEKLPQEIEFNFEQLKAELSQRMEKYRSLVVTEDGIKDAKADRTALNKLKTALDEERKRVKAACLKPYDVFEYRISELVGLIDGPIIAIDTQVRAFDEAKKEEKRKAIEQFYKINAKSLIDLVPLEKLWDDRWLNATFKIADIQTQIVDVLTKVRNDIGIIRAMKCECEDRMLDSYLQSLDMSAALAEKTRFEERQKHLAEHRRKEAVPTRTPVTRVIDGSNDFTGLQPGDHVVFGDNVVTASTEVLDFRVWVTPEQKSALKQFLKDNDIKFGRVQ